MNEFKQIFPLVEKNDAYAQYFTGQSFLVSGEYSGWRSSGESD